MLRPSEFLAQLRGIAVPLVIFSLITNLAVLISPLFMMHVLDRVVPSQNINTLLLLLGLAMFALCGTSAVEYFRDRSLGRVSNWAEKGLAATVLARPSQDSFAGPLRDVAKLRDFLSSSKAATLFDLPWVPLFMVALFLLHPAFLGLLAVLSILIAVVQTLSDRFAEDLEKTESQQRGAGMAALSTLESAGPESQLMSIGGNLQQRYVSGLGTAAAPGLAAHRFRTLFSTLNRLLRMMMQVGSLALGAYLVTLNELSVGAMVGASILMGKTIGIVEGLLGLLADRKPILEALSNLQQHTEGDGQAKTEIAELTGSMKVIDVTVPRGNGLPARLERVSFRVAAGECLASMGECGSGKTTLLEAMCGFSPAPIGNAFMDETDIRTLDPDTLSKSIGYVPQTGHVFATTIAQNIARFAVQPDDAKVLAAARLAGVHGMISALPDAYETDLGKYPHLLTAGQKQRIAFARALYEMPKYLFMDEPNALLDSEGERALGQTLLRLKSMGVTIVMAMHRSGILSLADKVMQLEHGRIADFGPKSEVLGRLGMCGRRIELPILDTSAGDLRDWVASQFTRAGD